MSYSCAPLLDYKQVNNTPTETVSLHSLYPYTDDGGITDAQFGPCTCDFVRDCRSPLRWIGGKFNLAKKIIPHFPEHVCYVEPFAGAAHVLFRKTRSSVEVINDINGELVNFYRVLARFPEYFEYKMKYVLYSRQVFYELRDTDPDKLPEEDRAWRFFYLNRCCFNTKGMGELCKPVFGMEANKDSQGLAGAFARLGNVSFGASSHKQSARNPDSAFARLSGLTFGCVTSTDGSRNVLIQRPSVLRQAWERLRRVIIEHKPYADCIRIYDRPQTLFYIDPPYYGCEKYYGHGLFERADFENLAAILANIKGKFLLSINDCPETRELFSAFKVKQELMALYTANDKANIKKPELLIANY